MCNIDSGLKKENEAAARRNLLKENKEARQKFPPEKLLAYLAREGYPVPIGKDGEADFAQWAQNYGLDDTCSYERVLEIVTDFELAIRPLKFEKINQAKGDLYSENPEAQQITKEDLKETCLGIFAKLDDKIDTSRIDEAIAEVFPQKPFRPFQDADISERIVLICFEVLEKLGWRLENQGELFQKGLDFFKTKTEVNDTFRCLDYSASDSVRFSLKMLLTKILDEHPNFSQDEIRESIRERLDNC